MAAGRSGALADGNNRAQAFMVALAHHEIRTLQRRSAASYESRMQFAANVSCVMRIRLVAALRACGSRDSRFDLVWPLAQSLGFAYGLVALLRRVGFTVLRQLSTSNAQAG